MRDILPIGPWYLSIIVRSAAAALLLGFVVPFVTGQLLLLLALLTMEASSLGPVHQSSVRIVLFLNWVCDMPFHFVGRTWPSLCSPDTTLHHMAILVVGWVGIGAAVGVVLVLQRLLRSRLSPAA